MKQEGKVQQPLKEAEEKVQNPPVISGMRASDYPCKSTGSHKFACITRSCPHYAFVCIEENCICQKSHKDCLIVKAQCITSNLEKRIIPYKPIEDCINQKVDKAIDLLSEHRDKLLLEMKQKFECFGLTSWQKQIYKTVKNKQESDITGHQLWQLQLSFKSLKISKDIFQQHSLQINKMFQQVKEQAEEVFSRVKKYLNEFKLKTQNYLVTRQQILTQAYEQIQKVEEYKQIKRFTRIFKGSQVVNLSDVHRIRNMFKPRQLKLAKLIYRASINDFSLQKFHQIWEYNLDHTIFFCTTQFNKKIGGFYSRPNQKQSFVFSLTNNDKFKPKTDKNLFSVYYNSRNSCPSFGQDFRICDSANEKRQSSAYINKSYQNSNYKANDKYSWQKFSGSISGKFKIKEWQCWLLEFE